MISAIRNEWYYLMMYISRRSISCSSSCKHIHLSFMFIVVEMNVETCSRTHTNNTPNTSIIIIIFVQSSMDTCFHSDASPPHPFIMSLVVCFIVEASFHRRSKYLLSLFRTLNPHICCSSSTSFFLLLRACGTKSTKNEPVIVDIDVRLTSSHSFSVFTIWGTVV